MDKELSRNTYALIGLLAIIISMFGFYVIVLLMNGTIKFKPVVKWN